MNLYNGTRYVLARINDVDGTILEQFEVYSQDLSTNPLGIGGADGYIAVLVRDAATNSFIRTRLFDSILGQCVANYNALTHYQGTSVAFVGRVLDFLAAIADDVQPYFAQIKEDALCLLVKDS